MKKFIVLTIVVTIFFMNSPAKSEEQCFYPASFFPILNVVKLPCVYIDPELCYFAYLGVELKENHRLSIFLISVNATDISPQQFSHKDYLPYYDPDNDTVVIPVLVYLGKSYKVVLKPKWINSNLYFDLVDIFILPDVPKPICIPSIENTDINAEFYPTVYSYKLLEKEELKLCYEFEGSPEFISIVAKRPPVMLVGSNIKITGQYAPCPSNYIIGCYKFDEDRNWYAMYKYKEIDSPFGFMVLFCPKEDGYKMIP